MNILDKIVLDKREEVSAKKRMFGLDFFQRSPFFNREPLSLAVGIRMKSGIIAEFKRRSPSRQIINQSSSVLDVASGYEQAGASGISVLTDTKYFGGALDDLIQVRSIAGIPVLRKEFIVDGYQIYESKAYGADVILLIAAILSPGQIADLSQLAQELKLEVLLEIHNEEELSKSDLSHIDLVGVNNRNLKTFTLDLETSRQLANLIPDQKVKVSESGISETGTIRELKKYGYEGFLMGENFMKTEFPGKAAELFIKDLE
jgi:indole-3-glycerol phosphate synthase